MVTATLRHTSCTTERLWQWDYGQVLRIQGDLLPDMAEVHFSLSGTGQGESVTRIGVTQDAVMDVPIPDALLEGDGTGMDYPIFAYLYLSDSTSGHTLCKIMIPVRARVQPGVLSDDDAKDNPTGVLLDTVREISASKADGMDYQDDVLRLLAGEKELARVTITGGSSNGSGSAAPVQADYEQTDSTAVDYIKNKPFYEEIVPYKTELSGDNWTVESDMSVSMIAFVALTPCDITDGDRIKIEADDRIYESTVAYNEDLGGFLGGDIEKMLTGDYDNFNFAWVYYQEQKTIMGYIKGDMIPEYGSCTVYKQQIKTIDKKFLPANYVETINGKLPDENGEVAFTYAETVNGKEPDENKNVTLTPDDIGASTTQLIVVERKTDGKATMSATEIKQAHDAGDVVVFKDRDNNFYFCSKLDDKSCQFSNFETLTNSYEHTGELAALKTIQIDDKNKINSIDNSVKRSGGYAYLTYDYDTEAFKCKSSYEELYTIVTANIDPKLYIADSYLDRIGINTNFMYKGEASSVPLRLHFTREEDDVSEPDVPPKNKALIFSAAYNGYIVTAAVSSDETVKVEAKMIPSDDYINALIDQKLAALNS